MQLGRLSGMERDKIEEEYQALVVKIEDLRSILADESKVLEIIKNDLTDIKNKYGDERRTEISMVTTEIDIDDLSTKKILSLQLLIKVTQNVCLSILINRKDAEVAVFQVLQLVKRTSLNTCLQPQHTTHCCSLQLTVLCTKLKGYQIPEASRQAKVQRL